MDGLELRDVVESDVAIFFDHQRDPQSCHMAAFTSEDPNDRAAFLALWAGILASARIVKRTIVVDGEIVGNIVHFSQYGLPAVGYWIDRAHWGRGIASHALGEFLKLVAVRPVYARTALDNVASQRVLEKNGFVEFERDRAYATARAKEIVERILVLR